MRYERRGWRAIREGDRLKDPATHSGGDPVVVFAARWGYRTANMIGVRPWPKVGRLKVITHIDARMITVEGRLGPDMVGVNVTAGVGASPEVLVIVVENAIKALRHMHPGVEGITAGDWRTITVPLDDVE